MNPRISLRDQVVVRIGNDFVKVNGRFERFDLTEENMVCLAEVKALGGEVCFIDLFKFTTFIV
jgi:hypothetical protein